MFFRTSFRWSCLWLVCLFGVADGLAQSSSAPTADPAAAPAAAAAMEPFGMGTHVNEAGSFALAKQAGVQWLRMDISWYTVEKKPGEWNFGPVDAGIEKANALGLKVLAVLSYSTEWSTSGPAGDKKRLKYAQREEFDAAYQNYLRTVVTRYKDKVAAWELHNEIDHSAMFDVGPGCWAMNHCKEASKNELRRRQYLHMVELAMPVLKPLGVTITTSGFAMGGSFDFDAQSMGWVTRQPDVLRQFDVFNCHAYGWPKHDELKNTLAQMHAVVKDTNVPIPLWLTEHGIDGIKTADVNPAAAKSYLLKSYAMALGGGAEKLFWYRFAPGLSKHVTLLDAQNKPTFLFDVYRMMTQQWAQPMRFAPVNAAGLEGARATLKNGSEVLLVWATGKAVPLSQLGQRVAQVVDMNGQAAELTADAAIGNEPVFVHVEPSPADAPRNP